jgi:hypothetical protein
MPNLSRKIEVAANVAIILLVLLLGGILIRNYWFGNRSKRLDQHQSAIKGSQLQLKGVDWGQSERSLVLVLSSKCHFCTESMPFYQRIAAARQHKALRLIAVLPQDLGTSREYLEDGGFLPDAIVQARPESLGASGTPTLILVDSKGVAVNSWEGKLRANEETEMLQLLRL